MSSAIETAAVGRLGGAPQRRQTKEGKPFATLSLAVGKGDDLQGLQVTVFDPYVNDLPLNLEKGERLYVEGKLRLNYWESADGKRANLQVTATKVVVLDRIGLRRKASCQMSEKAEQAA